MEEFHKRLKLLINAYILLGYKITENFPKHELYGMTSHARRALLSIMLNYVEGYGRSKKGFVLQFYEFSFGSLKESIYVFYLALQLKHIALQEYEKLFTYKEEIAKMMWKTINGLRQDIKE
mgnify:CR=1 FL=1